MKRYKINYHSIQSDHILATPEFTHSEIVEVDSDEKLQEYIESKTDGYDNHFKKEDKPFFGFDYISRTGGVKVEEYNPKIIKL